MADRLMGMETEYAFTAMGPGGEQLNRDVCLLNFLKFARSELPHLPGMHSSGMFLQNGSRFYIDCGLHPELSTPEYSNPWDAVRYVKAGERILESLASKFEKYNPSVSEVMIFKCNVDYADTQATWGCHESYLHRANTDLLSGQIIPHLVSRVIYSGAGGFNPFSAGLEYSLSPRAYHIRRNISGKSTSGRGIFHTKDEPLCGNGYHRLHLLCGESLCSETATWLKVGATSLVAAMIEANMRPGDAVTLKEPVNALHSFANDPACRAAEPSADGRDLTAIAIQRHYLQQAENCVQASWMPPWAEEICRHWRVMLDRLEDAPSSVETTLDWAIKQALFSNYVRQRGMKWEALADWTRVLSWLRDALRDTEYRDKPVTADFVLSRNSPITDKIRYLTPFLLNRDLKWDGLKPFLELRQELFEIDMRFSQLGSKSIFNAMANAGVLDHHVPGVDRIENAISHPPAVGRACLRGKCVRRFAGENGRYKCDWDKVWDRKAKVKLDLSDPFATKEHWVDLPQDQQHESRSGIPPDIRRILEAVTASR